MNLTYEAVRKIVQTGSQLTDLKQTNTCDYVMQIIENYIPQQSKEKLDSLICFRISDGYAKMKALFLKANNEQLSKLQANQNENLNSFPVIRVLSFRVVGKIINGEDFPILVQDFKILDTLEKIIGQPISYKAYLINGFKNLNGATCLDDFELAGIGDILESEVKQVSKQQQSNAIQEEKQVQKPKLNIKFSISKKKVEEPIVQKQEFFFEPKKPEQQTFKMPVPQQQLHQQFIPEFQVPQQQVQQQQVPQQRVPQLKQQNQQQKPQQIQLKQPNDQSKQMKNNQFKNSEADFFPMQQINPSFQQPFRGRIVKLNEVRTYQAKVSKKEGKLFAIQIQDESSMVLATFFDAAAEKFHDFLIEGKCYIFSGAQVKPPRNPDTLANLGCILFDFTFDSSAKITEIDDIEEIPMNTFHFIKLQKITTVNIASIVDVIVVIKVSTGVKEFMIKNRDEKSQRNLLTVYDDSLYETEITLYGNYSGLFQFQPGQIYIFKGLKVTEYQGKRQLQSSYQTTIYEEGKINECQQLRKWVSTFNGKLVEPVPKIKLISQLIEDSQKCELDQNAKIYSDVRAQLILIKSNGTLYYPSCTNCYKKAVDYGDHHFCNSCNIKMKQPKLRYILSCKIADQSGNLWVSVGDQYANILVDVPAEKIKTFIDENQEKEKQEALNSKAYKEFRFKILSKLEEFNDQKRVKHSVQSIVPVNTADTQAILNSIDFYMKNI